MSKRAIPVVVALCLLLTLALSPWPARARPAAPSTPVTRPWAPVVVTASALPDLVGAPLASLAVWVYRDGAWRLIPWQVDEVVNGLYTAADDGLFNNADELTVTLDDLGDAAPASLTGAQRVVALSVTDPLAPDAAPRVAYVARMAAPVAAPNPNAIRYEAATRRLVGATYTLGLDAQKPFISSLTLNGGSANLIDRSKARVMLNLCFGSCLTLTEDSLPTNAIEPLKSGPVRVVLSPQGGFAYRDGVSLRTQADLSAVGARVLQVRLSVDLAATASGAVYRDANVPAGVTVDGAPDNVPDTPFSPWRQVDFPDGRLVSLFTVTTPNEGLLNYYRDNRTTDNNDTGDKMSYGDSGVIVKAPTGPTLGVDAAFWAFPTGTAIDGATLARQVANPLQVTASRPLWPALYLPLLSRSR